ncbi:unnamed protein product [Phaeothamnion confervicola]
MGCFGGVGVTQQDEPPPAPAFQEAQPSYGYAGMPSMAPLPYASYGGAGGGTHAAGDDGGYAGASSGSCGGKYGAANDVTGYVEGPRGRGGYPVMPAPGAEGAGLPPRWIGLANVPPPDSEGVFGPSVLLYPPQFEDFVAATAAKGAAILAESTETDHLADTTAEVSVRDNDDAAAASPPTSAAAIAAASAASASEARAEVELAEPAERSGGRATVASETDPPEAEGEVAVRTAVASVAAGAGSSDGKEEMEADPELEPGLDSVGAAMSSSQADSDAEADAAEAWVNAGVPGQHSVVRILGVDDSVTPEALCQLFGLYGDVMKVKVTRGDRGMALVQLRHAVQADKARHFLDGALLAGRRLRADVSTQAAVKDRSAADFARLHQVHRFAGVPSPEDPRYLEHLCAPCATLVVDNLPPDCPSEELSALLAPHGHVSSLDVDAQTNQAVVQMDCVQSAVHALIMTHNSSLKGHVLRVLFFNRSFHGR